MAFGSGVGSANIGGVSLIRKGGIRGALDHTDGGSKDPLEQMYQLYNSGVEQQAGDYDDIMGKYRDVYNRSMDPNAKSDFTPYTAAQAVYTKSGDTTKALKELEDLAKTGGLDETAQQNLRARGISPIRAMYATGQRDVERQRRLQGGYSPNYGAVTAKMTRDRSSLIADQMDKVNANIAEMVQSGRLSAAPNYASAAQAESALATGVETGNVAARNEAAKFNAGGMFDDRRGRRSDALGAAQGMTGLYGTTPALAKLYGDQAMGTAKFQADEAQRKETNKIGALGRMYGG